LHAPQEIEILRQLRHENIIQMLDAFETKTDFCVVTGVRQRVAWRGVAWRGVAWRGVAWRGVAWRGVARTGYSMHDLECVRGASA
jgi:hypothetical protein